MEITTFKNRKIDFSQPVRIYRNLNRKGQVYSVWQKGFVVAHMKEFVLRDVTFVVNKSGKERAIRTKTRNVHAFIEGLLVDFDNVLFEFSYNLYYKPFTKDGFFVKLLGEQEILLEVSKAEIVYKTEESNLMVQNYEL